MHAVHKMLATAAGKDQVSPGEFINAKVDVAGINDVYLIVLDSFREMLATKVWDRDRVYVCLDHLAPAPNLIGAENQKGWRDFVREQGCHVTEINEGICHKILPEKGAVRPGSIVIITDSHTPIHGAYGAFGTGVGATDMAAILSEGTIWLRVPDVINVKLNGKLPKGVMAKDITLHILGELGTSFANYKVIEFSGPVVEELPMEERTVLTVMGTEMGAKSTYIKPDKTTLDFIKSRSDKPLNVHETDPDYKYVAEYEFDVSNLKPQVAIPHSVDNARNVEDVAGIPIDQVFLGSCTGGNFNDIEVFAKAIEGKKVAPNTRLIVTMSSKEVLEKSLEKGYYQILLTAGAHITAPGCGCCGGLFGGVIAAHERCVSTTNRNFPGRMGGSKEAEVYLVSPLTAAATAIAGKLTNQL